MFVRTEKIENDSQKRTIFTTGKTRKKAIEKAVV